MVRVEGGLLKEIRCVDMIAHLYAKIHLLHEFALQAVAGAFAVFETSARKLGIVFSTNEFICHQYLFLFIDENAINAKVETAHQNIFLRRKSQPIASEITNDRNTTM